ALGTPRLRLRIPALGDARAIFESYAADPEVTRFVSWTPHPNPEVTEKFIENYCMAGWAKGDVFSWLITLVEDDQTAGMIDLRLSGCRTEMGNVLARRFWRRGLMSEAARTVADWAIGAPEIHRVWAVVDLENVASQRVLERAGMVREGVLRRWAVFPNLGSRPRDVLCFARVKDTELPQ
ncbi:MAG TPA: GNAT family N-acetyltransferase, partial [Methylomirabilota bacterium]